jgi:hypothetical protein
MKVSDAKTVGPGPSPGGAPDADVPVRATSPSDRVTTEEASRLASSISNSINLAAGERALRLQSLTQEVRSGAYRPNVSQLADEILAQADLDARLARRL